jgi:hypothetical protein
MKEIIILEGYQGVNHGQLSAEIGKSVAGRASISSHRMAVAAEQILVAMQRSGGLFYRQVRHGDAVGEALV